MCSTELFTKGVSLGVVVDGVSDIRAAFSFRDVDARMAFDAIDTVEFVEVLVQGDLRAARLAYLSPYMCEVSPGTQSFHLV